MATTPLSPLQKAIQNNHTGNRALSNNLIKVQEVKATMADIAAEAAKKAQKRETEDEGDSPVHTSSRDGRSSYEQGQGSEAKAQLAVGNNGGQALEHRGKPVINVETPAVKPPMPENGTTSKKNIRPAKSPFLLDEEYYSGLTDR